MAQIFYFLNLHHYTDITPYWKGQSVNEHWLKQIPPHIRELAVKTGIIDVEIKTQSVVFIR